MNFDKENFAKILVKIKNTYGSINKMSEKMGITTAYLSKLIRLKYDNAPSPDILNKISSNSNGIITYNELMEVCGYISKNEEFASSNINFYMCPVYNYITSNNPNWVLENIEGRIPIPLTNNTYNPENCFYLKINDNSMNQLIKLGAYALIHKQDSVKNGEIAVVVADGNNATLRKFTMQDDFIILESMPGTQNSNDKQTRIYSKNEPIIILGKYIGKFEME